MSRVSKSNLPIAVIGAGPVGLAAAAHLLDRGLIPVVLEAGAHAGAAIQSWGHVRVFSPWKYMVDAVAANMLTRTGWQMPAEDSLPTGSEFVSRYVQPLAALPAIAAHVRYDHRVIAVSRSGIDKAKSDGRDDVAFVLLCSTSAGTEVRIHASAVIDASGTYGTPNPLGASGLRLPGETIVRDRIAHGIPDIRGRDRDRYVGRRTLVVGSGHSAFNALLDLAWLKTEVPDTGIVWAVRRAEPGLLFGGGAKDELPARGSLGGKVKQLVQLGVIEMVTGFRASHITRRDDGVIVHDGDRTLMPVDRIIAATGFRPDIEMLREVRLALDPALEAPVRLASLIDPNVHSCGTVYPHGYQELRHPETDFYIVGMKSYGRAPTFLLLTGYEQTRSVVAALAGDITAARNVELTLPETGVCSTGDNGGSGGGCCTASVGGVGLAQAAGAC